MARQAVIAPLGIITRPNQYGQYPPGACSALGNVVFRAPGIAEPIPAVEDILNAYTSATGKVARKLWPSSPTFDAANKILSATQTVSGGAWQLWINSQALVLPSSVAINFADAYANGSYVRDRWILSDSRNPIVVDSTDATTVRWAGLRMPNSISLSSVTATDASALTNGHIVYRAHFQRKIATAAGASYVITGAVSNSFDWTSLGGGTYDAILKIAWDDASMLIAGDTIELYKTLKQATGTDAGDDEFFALSYTLTATDISNSYALVRDFVPESGLGASLYTNTDQLGIAKSYQIPPPARDICTFKGYTFYSAYKVANHISLRIPNQWGDLSGSAQLKYGIGTRVVTCGVTATSPTCTIGDTSGIAVGQRVTASAFAAPAYVVSIVTNTSFTVDKNSGETNAAKSVTLTDRIEINGTRYDMGYPSTLPTQAASASGLEIRLDQSSGEVAPAVYISALGVGLRISMPLVINGALTVRATNGANYSPPLNEFAGATIAGTYDARGNRLIYSELDQPEACPEGNELLIGSGDVYRIIATRDAMWVFASDGLWRVSGENENWRVDPIDSTLKLATPNSVDVMRDVIYAYTNRGAVAITDNGIENLTQGIVDNLIAGAEFAVTWTTFLCCDQFRSEVWLMNGGTETSARTPYFFNTVTRAWSKYVPYGGTPITSFGYNSRRTSLIYGAGGFVGYTNPGADIVTFTLTTAKLTDSFMRFQPLLGDGEPTTLKQFIDATVIFGNTEAALPLSLYAYWDEAAPDTTARTTRAGNSVAASDLSSETRITFGVPRNQAVAVALRFGFNMGSFSGNDQAWQLRGVSLRFELVAEESLR